jgi:uroporphyrinogen-III synthase
MNLQHRQPHVHRRREIRLISTVGFLVGAEIEMARLEDANINLAEQLQTRKIVERAKGILQRDMGLSEEQAYLTLQRQSRQKRKAMREIAEAIVLSDEVRGSSASSKLS